MKANKIILIISVILIAALFVWIGIQHRKINRLTDQNQLQAVELSVLNDSVSVYRNKAGELTYKLISVEVDRDNLKKSLELAGFDIKLLKAKDIEWRRITNALKLRLETVGNGEAVLRDTLIIAGRDSIITTDFRWSNNYLSLDGVVDIDRVKFSYFYRTGIEIIQAEKRNKTVVSVSLADPNAAITSGNSITINRKTKWWEKPWLWGLAGLGAGVFLTK